MVNPVIDYTEVHAQRQASTRIHLHSTYILHPHAMRVLVYDVSNDMVYIVFSWMWPPLQSLNHQTELVNHC